MFMKYSMSVILRWQKKNLVYKLHCLIHFTCDDLTAVVQEGMIGSSLWVLNSMRQKEHTQHFTSANHSPHHALPMAKIFKHLRVTLPEVWESQGIPSVWAGYAISDFGRRLWKCSFETKFKLSSPQYSFFVCTLKEVHRSFLYRLFT